MNVKKMKLVFAILGIAMMVTACGSNKTGSDSEDTTVLKEEKKEEKKEDEKSDSTNSDDKEYYPYQKMNGEYITLTDGTVLSEGPYCSTNGMYIMNQKTSDGKIIERYENVTSGVTFNNLDNGVKILVSEYDPLHHTHDKEKIDLSSITTSKDILNQFAFTIAGVRSSDYNVAELIIDSEESVEIQCGLDTTKWCGSMTVEKEGKVISPNIRFVAYGILGRDGRPYLIASVLDERDLVEGYEYEPYFSELAEATVQTFYDSPMPEGASFDDATWSFRQYGIFEWEHTEK